MFAALAENYYALAIAILYRQPVNAEDSFELFSTGRIERLTREERKERERRALCEDMAYMRKSGLTWSQIGDILEVRQPQKFFAYNTNRRACGRR